MVTWSLKIPDSKGLLSDITKDCLCIILSRSICVLIKRYCSRLYDSLCRIRYYTTILRRMWMMCTHGPLKKQRFRKNREFLRKQIKDRKCGKSILEDPLPHPRRPYIFMVCLILVHQNELLLLHISERVHILTIARMFANRSMIHN